MIFGLILSVKTIPIPFKTANFDEKNLETNVIFLLF